MEHFNGMLSYRKFNSQKIKVSKLPWTKKKKKEATENVTHISDSE